MDENNEPLTEEQATDTPAKSLLRRLRPLFLLALLVGLLPSICTLFQCHRALLNLVAPKLAANVQFDNMTTHWWASVRLANVQIHEAPADDSIDPDVSIAGRQSQDGGPKRAVSQKGAPLLTARAVTSDQPLWSLLISMGRNASFSVIEPELTVRTIGTETNVEHTMRHLFGESSSDQSASLFPVSVVIKDGTVRLVNANGVSGSSGLVSMTDVQGLFSTGDGHHSLPDLELTATVANPSPHADLAAGRSRSVNPRIAATLDQLSTDFPLVPFEPHELQNLEQADENQTIRISLKKDEATAGLHHLDVQIGRLNLDQFGPAVHRLFPGFDLEGQVSCLMQAHVLTTQQDRGFAGRVQFAGRNLLARHRDWYPTEAVRLKNVTAGGVVAMADDGVMVKDLNFRSPILNISGSGEVKVSAVDPVKALRKAAQQNAASTEAMLTEAEALSAGEVTINGQVDLAELTRMLPQTLNLVDDVRLDRADVDFSCRIRQQSNEKLSRQLSGPARPGFQWQLAAETSSLQARRGTQTLNIQAPLRIDAMGPLNLQSVTFSKGRLAGDFGDLNIDPVDLGFAVEGVVRPAKLHETLSQIVDLPSVGLAGDVDVQGTIQWLKDGSLKATALHLEGEDLLITSPQIQIHPTAALVRMIDGEIQVKSQSDTLRVLLAPWHDATWLSPGSRLQAVIQCRPDKMAVQALIEPHQLSVRGSTQRSFSSSGGFQLDHARAKFELAARPDQQVYDLQSGVLELPGLQAEVSGTLELVDDLVFADLVALTEYDLDVLMRNVLEIDPLLVTLKGRQQQPFSIRGCLSAWNEAELQKLLMVNHSKEGVIDRQPLSIAGAVTWESGQLMGLPVSSGVVRANFNEGLIRTQPIRCTIGTGTLSTMAQYDINRSLLTLAPGSRLENLELNEQFTRQWLGYAMPMLGDATQVRGHLSCRIDQCDYDVNQVDRSLISGRVDVHDASATTGESANSILSVLALLDKEAAQNFQQLTLPPQTIQLQMQSGQIAHDQLLMQLGKYELSSRGIVTTDQRLNLTLTVPVSEQASRYTGSRSLQIPVTGTISRPLPNTRGLLQNVGQQQLQNRVNEELDKGLNRLFDKLR